jgi:hypothetical protein
MQQFDSTLWKTGVYTGRALAALVLFLTAAQWFNTMYRGTIEDLALAMGLSTVSCFILAAAWVIDAWQT